MEFGADECHVMPLASYHLDYDVTLRSHEGELVAFVNDSAAAARLIVGRAARMFEETGLMSAERARASRENLAAGDIRQM